MRHLRIIAVMAACIACGCTVIRYRSNLVGGADCEVADAGGVAILVGAYGFPVESARESRLSFIPAAFQADGGLIAMPDAGSPPFIWLELRGSAGKHHVYATLPPLGDGGTWDGHYAIGDGGGALAVVEAYDDGGSSTLVAVSGEIQITNTENCSLTGKLSAWMGAADDDGGPELRGIFRAEYGQMDSTACQDGGGDAEGNSCRAIPSVPPGEPAANESRN